MRLWDELTKKQKKHIREMAVAAYEREIGAALDKLPASFQKLVFEPGCLYRQSV